MRVLGLFLVVCAFAAANAVPLTFNAATNHYGNPFDGACQSNEKNLTDIKGGENHITALIISTLPYTANTLISRIKT